jgi:predicted nucleic acid-binding protein
LLRWRLHRAAAEGFWHGLRAGVASVELVTEADVENAWSIGQDFADQDFSFTDRTSFAVMVRLGLTRAAAFDDHFAVFRFGPRRSLSFDVVR